MLCLRTAESQGKVGAASALDTCLAREQHAQTVCCRLKAPVPTTGCKAPSGSEEESPRERHCLLLG